MNLEPVSGKKAREVQVEESTTFRRGGAHLKEIILGFLRKKQVRLVERDFGQRTEHIIANWQALKNAGIPVVPTLRRLKKENSETLVMTDLRHDGSELYGKGLIFHLLVPEHTEDTIREEHTLDPFLWNS